MEIKKLNFFSMNERIYIPFLYLIASQTRWTETADSLARAYVNLTGDMMIGAGIIAYAGAFTASYRSRIIQSFVDMCREEAIPHTAKFSLTAILGEPVKV